MSPAFTVQFKLLSSLVWITETRGWLIVVLSLVPSSEHLPSIWPEWSIYIQSWLLCFSNLISSEETGNMCLSTSPTSFFSIPCLIEWLVCATLLTTCHLLLLFFAHQACEICSKTTTPCSHHLCASFKTQLICHFFIETFRTPTQVVLIILPLCMVLLPIACCM